jgi:hypothetical protein
VVIDKDTKGVAGSPPIAETILKKIEECAVFVADLTFVGESLKQLTDPAEKPRLFPNPNVLTEHGFALKCHGHSALVGVMNTAYGKPDAESLPFDLRHLRWPIMYHLASPSDPDKENQFEKLVGTLVEAIGLILSNFPSKYIASGYLEEYFVRALQNYLMFAQMHLQLSSPLLIEAGLVGIKGYSIAMRNNQTVGNALRDIISWQGEIEFYGKPAWEILGPFFDKVWANCGIQRTSQHHAAYVKQFPLQ